jgi:DNA helicase-2/ATP-dependent DNA helicase PcrA
VGITRAKKKLFITNAHCRMLYGSTKRNPESRFLSEIPKEYCNISRAPTLSFSGGGSYGGFSREDSYSRSSSFSGEHSFGGFSSQKKAPAPRVSAAPKTVAVDYKVGDFVAHKTFGQGMVLSLTSMGNDTLVEVAFEKVGTKKLMAGFANLKKV